MEYVITGKIQKHCSGKIDKNYPKYKDTDIKMPFFAINFYVCHFITAQSIFPPLLFGSVRRGPRFPDPRQEQRRSGNETVFPDDNALLP